MLSLPSVLSLLIRSCDSMDKLKSKLGQLREQLQVLSSFKEIYRYAFDFARVSQHINVKHTHTHTHTYTHTHTHTYIHTHTHTHTHTYIHTHTHTRTYTHTHAHTHAHILSCLPPSSALPLPLLTPPTLHPSPSPPVLPAGERPEVP